MAILMPKYLTPKLAEKAVQTAKMGVFGFGVSAWGEIPVNKRAFHVVILVPSMEDARDTDYPDWPYYPLKPHLLYEWSYRGFVGSSNTKTEWTGPYDEIARCKALQRWHDRADDGASVTPHLLFSGDTPYWGSVKREGIVVACSGVQPEFDRLIAGITADALIALALHAFKNDTEREGKDFLD